MAPDPNFWKSLRELHDDHSLDEHKVNEFMTGVTENFDVSSPPVMSRKQFLALLTASAAFAAAGCSSYRDKGEIVPYNKKPEEVAPGVANFYASTCDGCPQKCGILIKTREGRPIKLDGNPDHPTNRGKICAKGQASILNLYDPYRLRKPEYGKGIAEDLTWEKANAEVIRSLEQAVQNGKEIAIITGGIYSPTTALVLDDFIKKYPTGKIYSFQLFNEESRKHAWEKCYGSADLPVIDWEKAKIVLALESDLLGTEGTTVEQIRMIAAGRDIMRSSDFNRLYCVEGTISLTGANADYRLRLRPDAQLEFVLALLNEILTARGAGKPDKNIAGVIAQVSLKDCAERYGLSINTLQQLVADLLNHRGKAIVHAGSALPESAHILVNYLNEALGNTALYKEDAHVSTVRPLSSPGDFEQLVDRMKAGGVGILIHFGTNPVYHLPETLGYEDALRSVPLSVSLVESNDETSRLCRFVLPANHVFESWGDYKTRTGIYSLQQPVIDPLYDTRQKEAVLLAWINQKDPYDQKTYHTYLMSHWEKEIFPMLGRKVDFKSFWYSALHDGVVEFTEPIGKQPRFKVESLSAIPPLRPSSGFSVGISESYFLGDGTFANNGWLQEMPHPLSKIVWDNYAAVSPATAKELVVQDGDLITLTMPHGSLTVPVFLQPGQADKFISVAAGYGRTNCGPVGTGVGMNVNPLMANDSLTGTKILAGVSVAKADGRHALVSTQEHHSLDDAAVKDFHLKRKIIQEGNLHEYLKYPEFIKHTRPELFSISKTVTYDGVKWAMAIDLNKCVGCNACVAGCNVENNIPVVGKEQAANGREMQWIRVDRYYSGTEENPAPSHQPMLCQHCDNAPCENVCPVSATNHSPDGLNQMVYNRCVGTRYCSNNCPYKVRRFNFFNWRDFYSVGYYEQQPVSLVNNPEVTVRSRGVMEKCTFCVQRIMEARQHAAEQGRPLKGSDVRTACQDACPASAIVFGDMNDSDSEIAKYRTHNLGYGVLEEINTKPNVTYLARLKNTEPEKLL